MKEETITVSGVTFNKDQVKTAIVIIEKREIYIGEKHKDRPVGFASKDQSK